MKTHDITKIPAVLAEVVRALGDEPVVLAEEGRPIAVLFPVEGADLETVSLSLNPEFLAVLERSRQRQRTEGGLSTEEMRRRLGIAPAVPKESKRRVRKPKTARPASRMKQE